MNKRIYYKQLNKYIENNINNKIIGKIVYSADNEECIKCTNCLCEECDNKYTYYYHYTFKNKIFERYINSILGTKISTNDFNLDEKLKRNIFKINNNTYIVVIGDNEYLKDTLVQKFKIKQLKTEE